MPEGAQSDLPKMEVVGDRHKTLSEAAFDVLSRAIVAGVLKDDEHLSEATLASRMNISRAPVREALAELAKRGLVIQVPRKGTFVRHWSKTDLWEIATLRSVLEGLAARMASTRFEVADKQFLRELVNAMRLARDEGKVSQVVDLDLAFHARIWQCSGHKRLQATLEDMELQIRFFMTVTRDSDLIDLTEQHRTLLDELFCEDPDRAQRAIVEHIVNSASLELQSMPEEGLRAVNVSNYGNSKFFSATALEGIPGTGRLQEL